MSDDENKVVDLPAKPKVLRPKDTTSMQLVIDNTDEHCRHRERLVRTNIRKVTCKTCGADLDPFQVLVDITRESPQWRNDFHNANQELKAVRERIAMLKRLEDNARARVRKFGAKAGKSYLDNIIRYVRNTNPKSADLTDRQIADSVEMQLAFREPIHWLTAAVAALEKKEIGVAVEFGRRAIDGMYAALGADEQQEPTGPVVAPEPKPRKSRRRRGDV